MDTTTLEQQPVISIVMATCSRAHLLPKVLDALLAQTMLKQAPVEMVIVDDQSTDNTPDLLREYQSRAPIAITVVRGAKQGVAAARNLGVSHARGEWLASFDDDEVAPPEWLESLYTCAIEHQAACVGGATQLSLPEGRGLHEFGKRARALLGEMMPPAEQQMRWSDLPSTNNVLMRREVFLSLGGFDTSFTEGGEDTDLFQRMHAAGHVMWLCPGVPVFHLIPERRMEPHALAMNAMRAGAIEARLAGARKNTGGLLFNLAGRTAMVLVRDVPQLLLGKVTGNRAKSLDARLSLAVTAGLFRGVTAARGGSSKFLESMDFRSRHGERAETAKREQQLLREGVKQFERR